MVSNRHKGDAYAQDVGIYLKSLGHDLQPEYKVRIGIGSTNKKSHRFDWGNDSLLVECKAYDWTTNQNVPSAKLTTANEVMLYFHASPNHFRKLLFLLKTRIRPKGNPETLAEYYVRMNRHLIPDDVEVFEFDPIGPFVRQLWPALDLPVKIASEGQEKPSSINRVSYKSGDIGEVFPLKLGKTDYNQGFFNIPRKFDHLVEGSLVTLILGDDSLRARVNRAANTNGTARIIGGVALRHWFQSNYSLGDTVPVRFQSLTQLNLG